MAKTDAELTSDPNTIDARIRARKTRNGVLTRDALREYFSQFGAVVAITGLSKLKFGFIQFEEKSEAQACLEAGNFIEINGQKLVLNEAKVLNSSKKRMSEMALETQEAEEVHETYGAEIPETYEADEVEVLETYEAEVPEAYEEEFPETHEAEVPETDDIEILETNEADIHKTCEAEVFDINDSDVTDVDEGGYFDMDEVAVLDETDDEVLDETDMAEDMNATVNKKEEESVTTAGGSAAWSDADKITVNSQRDVEIMSDESRIEARIRIGKISSASVTEEKLRHYFSRFGTVVAVIVFRKLKYGFVQFKSKEEAEKCLQASTTARICGCHLDLRPAKIDCKPAITVEGASSCEAGSGGSNVAQDGTVPDETPETQAPPPFVLKEYHAAKPDPEAYETQDSESASEPSRPVYQYPPPPVASMHGRFIGPPIGGILPPGVPPPGVPPPGVPPPGVLPPGVPPPGVLPPGIPPPGVLPPGIPPPGVLPPGVPPPGVLFPSAAAIAGPYGYPFIPPMLVTQPPVPVGFLGQPPPPMVQPTTTVVPKKLSTARSANVDGGPLPPFSFKSYDPLDPQRPNDVEIVVFNVIQRGYAEGIEALVKNLNIKVDLLFPQPNLPVRKVLDDLKRQGCLYAMFIAGENEILRTVTLHVIYDIEQEHRNVPIADALKLIGEDFVDYVQKARQRDIVIPDEVHNLLIDCIEECPLALWEVEKLMRYIKHRQNAILSDFNIPLSTGARTKECTSVSHRDSPPDVYDTRSGFSDGRGSSDLGRDPLHMPPRAVSPHATGRRNDRVSYRSMEGARRDDYMARSSSSPSMRYTSSSLNKETRQTDLQTKILNTMKRNRALESSVGLPYSSSSQYAPQYFSRR